MTEVGTNFASIAEEYSEISTSIHGFLDKMSGLIETLETTFEDGQLPEIDAFITAYQVLENDLEEFDEEVEKLLGLLEDQYEPNSIEEIERIEQTAETLLHSVREFRDRCGELATAFSANGLEEQASALREVATAFDDLPEAIRNSLLDNHLTLAIKADYFPGELSDEVDVLVSNLESATGDQRQNTYGVLVMLANEVPSVVAPHADDLVDHLADLRPATKENLLTTLKIVARSTPKDNIAKGQALELLEESNPSLAVKAAGLLAEQSLTATEAESIANRMETTLDETSNPEVRINATFVLYTMAESYPEVFRDYESTIASLLDAKNPDVVENTIGILGRLGWTEYSNEIAEVRVNSTDPDVVAEAEEVLKEFEAAD